MSHQNGIAQVGLQKDRLDVIGNGEVVEIAHAWSFRGQDGKRALDEAREVLEGLKVTPRIAADAGLVAGNAVERLRRLGCTARSAPRVPRFTADR